jgi:transposase-like protein
MEAVQTVLDKLDVSLLGIISDDQSAIRRGVAQVWPEALHQRCHLHFLKAVEKPIYDADRSLAKELKKGAGTSAPSSVLSSM